MQAVQDKPCPPPPPNLELPVKDGTVQYSVRGAKGEAGSCGSTDRGVTYT